MARPDLPVAPGDLRADDLAPLPVERARLHVAGRIVRILARVGPEPLGPPLDRAGPEDVEGVALGRAPALRLGAFAGDHLHVVGALAVDHPLDRDVERQAAAQLELLGGSGGGGPGDGEHGGQGRGRGGCDGERSS
ncbi:hypothetical protein DMB42_51735 [Nonomuraea sp. WAC 01424]|nr:hypothetical protein DMB42_51735 [Nonomuraea sp. WAC 01424]